MTHPFHRPLPPTFWERLMNRVFPRPPVRVPVMRQGSAQAETDAKEMWATTANERRQPDLAPIAWSAPLVPAEASTMEESIPMPVDEASREIPPAMIEQVRLMMVEETQIVLPNEVVLEILTGDLGRRMLALGGMDIPLRLDIKDALGRRMVGKEWPHPKDTERQRPYRIGLQIAAKLSGYDILAV